MNENLNRLLYFVAIAEAGTMTSAAKRLGVSKAVVSKQLQLLEQDLGVTLLLRSPRKMHLTDIGSQFYEGARASVAQAQETYRLIRQREGKPSGSLRVSAPIDFGNMFVAPFAAKFSIENPAVNLALLFNDIRLNPVEEKFDIAYRVGWLEDSANIARKLVDFKLYAVAAPQFLSLYGIPNNLEELCRLPFIANTILDKPDKWTFKETSSKAEQAILFNRTISADTTQAVKVLLKNGAGFSIMPDFLIQSEILNGDLVKLLPQYALTSGGIYSVFPPVPYRSIATKAFDKLFREHFNN
jgi:DNA-binding transcriptional LysR family regulator